MRYDDELAQAVELIPDRLYFATLRRPDALSSSPTARNAICFSVDHELVYEPFFADFGPLNLGQAFRFCQKVSTCLKEAEISGKRVFYCCNARPQLVANACVLAGLYEILVRGRSAEEAYRPLMRYKPFMPYRDPSCGASSFDLTVWDCLKGMQKARDVGFVNFTNNTFDVEEYEYYEQVEHGDLNWIIPGKFVAFSGPSAKRTQYYGYQTLVPEDYVDYFKHKGVAGVVRLNKKMYDRRGFTNSGLHHYELYFTDGSTPPETILKQFLNIVENEPGALAVHCKAGLGRTGVLICCYMMKHYGFTAEEAIGYIRVCRPGSVIGPQQHFLRENQARMWRDGESFRQRQATAVASSSNSSRGSSASSDRTSVRELGTINEIDRRTSPVKSLRSGTMPSGHHVKDISRGMASASINESEPDPSTIRAFGKSASHNDRYGKTRTVPKATSAAGRPRAASVSASSPSFGRHIREGPAAAGLSTVGGGSGLRASMPAYAGWNNAPRYSRAPHPEQMRSASAATGQQSYLTGFHTTPTYKPAITRTLAPNGQPRKVPTALAMTGRSTLDAKGGYPTSPTSPSSRSTYLSDRNSSLANGIRATPFLRSRE